MTRIPLISAVWRRYQRPASHVVYLRSSPHFLIKQMKSPRMLQPVLSAFGDLYMSKLSKVLFGDHSAQWALFAQMTNWFMFYCTTQTLSNSMETVLTIMGLDHWPCMRVFSTKAPLLQRKWGLAAAALACAIRPTSAITWVYVGLLELIVARERLKFILLEVAPYWTIIELTSGTGTSLKDFLSCSTFIPFSIYGIILSKHWKLSGLIAWVLGFYSVLGHKEFRLVLPALPIALIFPAYTFAMIGKGDSSNTKGKRSASNNNVKKCFTKSQLAIVFLLVTTLPMAFYTSMLHQRGAEDVMNYLSREATTGRVKNVLFLTPCRATPYYSSLHQNIPMRFLDCTPSETKGIPDESDQFMMDPAGFASKFANSWSLPSHIILFDSQEKLLKDFLVLPSFREKRRFFHAHFEVD